MVVADSCPTAIGSSPAFRKVLQLIDRMAPTDHAVLISGPTGSGKEVVAQLIHHRGRRVGDPFVDLNCGALPEHLVESELFGHAKGAFTGANSAHPGLFEVAGCGTVFLDEIGELPLALQPKLLRVLETRSFRPVGASGTRRFEGRVVAATHRNLLDLVRQGKFREDLYYRLAVFMLELPGLDKRRDDIPVLVEHFAALQARPLTFAPAALERLRSHSWPGHIRQLRNFVDQIATLSDSDHISAEALETFLSPCPDSAASPDALFDALLALPGANKLHTAEQLLVDHALQRAHGSKTGAAQLLGVNRKVIERRLVARDRQRGLAEGALGSARHLVEQGAFREAVPVLQQALALLDGAGAQPELRTLRFDSHRLLAVCYRAVHGWLSAEAQVQQEAALRIGTGTVDATTLNSLQFGIWSTQLMAMQLSAARATAQEMLQRTQPLADAVAVAEANFAMANTMFWLGDCEEVLACLERGNLRCDSDTELVGSQGFDLRPLGVTFEGLASFQAGAFARAHEARAWLARAAYGSHPFNQALALQGAAWLACLFEDTEALGPLAAELVNVSIRHEFPFYRGIGQVFRGCHLAALGQYEHAEREMEEGYEVHILRNGGRLFYSFQAWRRGVALLAAGQHQRAESLLNAALDTGLEQRELAYLSEMLCTSSLARLARGDVTGAEDGLRSALSTARALGSVPGRIRAATHLAEVLKQTGRPHQAADMLAMAARSADSVVPFPGLMRALGLQNTF